MKQILLLLLIILSSLFFQGCTQPKPNTPLTVAQSFWTATLKGDVETAKQFLTPQSRPHFKIILKSQKDFVELGEQSISSSKAEILTQLTRHQDNQQLITALRTVLLNQQGQWLVDFDQTRDSMLGSDFQSILDQLSDNMRETIDKGVKIMGESIKEEFHEMERQLQDSLQELDKELEKQDQNKKQQAQKTTTI